MICDLICDLPITGMLYLFLGPCQHPKMWLASVTSHLPACPANLHGSLSNWRQHRTGLL